MRILLPPVTLIISVLGSILTGMATPTEAAAVGAVGATLLAGLKLRPDEPQPIYVAAGSMLYSTGEGDWTATSLGGSGAKDVPGSGPGSVYAVGYSGVWQSAGGPGATWTPINAPSNDAMRAVWVADQGAWVYVVGDDGLQARAPGSSRRRRLLRTRCRRFGAPARPTSTSLALAPACAASLALAAPPGTCARRRG